MEILSHLTVRLQQFSMHILLITQYYMVNNDYIIMSDYI